MLLLLLVLSKTVRSKQVLFLLIDLIDYRMKPKVDIGLLHKSGFFCVIQKNVADVLCGGHYLASRIENNQIDTLLDFLQSTGDYVIIHIFIYMHQ